MLNWSWQFGSNHNVNWGFLFLRSAIGLGLLTLFFLSQRFWYRTLWRVTAGWGLRPLRFAARLLYFIVLLLIVGVALDSLRMGHGRILPRPNLVSIFTGLWFFSALFAFLAVKLIRGLERLWIWSRNSRRSTTATAQQTQSSSNPGFELAAAPPAGVELLENPSRRYFFRAATAAAGAAPFLGAMYGFSTERLNYQIRRVEIPFAGLPPALDGMKIAQLSDIHLSGFMPRAQVRRAVDMANELGADLAVVTGDFITGASDPLEDCIDEIRRLHAPLGIWGCNGNHEIYADAEDTAQVLFAQAGMKLLRSEHAQLTFNGAQFNLLGVDYQRERTAGGRRVQMLATAARLVRRDLPNILLSHNPNAFNRAAELGIELTLSGHTHGGQIQVEILDHRLSPARFITDYIAGLYKRPLGANSKLTSSELAASSNSLAPAHLYVNRGLGTVGAPVRLGVPPEISLIILRRT